MEEGWQKKAWRQNALKRGTRKNAIIVVKHLFKCIWKVNRGQYSIDAQNQWSDESILKKNLMCKAMK